MRQELALFLYLFPAILFCCGILQIKLKDDSEVPYFLAKDFVLLTKVTQECKIGQVECVGIDS